MARGGDQISPEARAALARRREEVRSMFLETGDVDETAQEVGLHPRTVLRYTRDLRPESPSHVRYSPELWDRIEAFLRDEEASYAEASRTFGPGVKRIREKFPDLGWSREQAGRHQGEVNHLMRKLERATYANGS